MANDESYVIDLCDRVLKLKASRQHRFDFLIGDPGRNGRCVRLPVDAYYHELRLAIEYREKQHTEAIRHFDKPNKQTCSGCDRGEQRRIYDERRRAVLPMHGIRLMELDYSLFQHDARKRLRRDAGRDEAVIRRQLFEFLPLDRGIVAI